MDTPTHALIPVIAYGLMRQKQLVSGTREEKIAVWRNAALIALVGALPDMVDPHVSLEERLHSWSHSLVGWAGFSALFAALCLAGWRWWTPGLAIWLSLAYGSHLVGDAIAGGLGWSYPIGDHVVGDYYIPPRWWIPANFISLGLAYAVYRVLPRIAMAGQQFDRPAKSAPDDPPEGGGC